MTQLAAPLLMLLALAGAVAAQTPDPWSHDSSAAETQALMASGAMTSQQVVQASLSRIKAIDRAGPRLGAVLALNPHALADARKLDAARRARGAVGPLYGLPVLLKDNIEARDDTATTAGSLALAANVPTRDAPLVRRLAEAGAVILGKTNLSEWANFRSPNALSGWSAVGGLTRNPYALDRTACGSSAGSAAAVAAGLAPLAVGTETDGSITCPASMNGVVGLKPTVGLVSRAGIVPISPSQDTAGPMARTVADVAALLSAMAGSDPADPATREADAHRTDYAARLDAGALKGARLAVYQPNRGRSPPTDAVFDRALATLRAAGAVLVEVKGPDTAPIEAAEQIVLAAEFKTAINAYLAATPRGVRTRTLAEVIAFNAAEPRETALFGQEIFQAVVGGPGLDNPLVVKARADGRRLAGPEGLDRMLREADAVAVVAPTNAPAFVNDVVNGARWAGSVSTLPAVAGYPHLTTPMGAVAGLPVGLSLIGPAWSEARLLSLGYAFEQAAHARQPPSFPASINERPEIAAAFAPATGD